MNQKGIEIGRLLRSSITGFVAGCRVTEFDNLSFGSLVRAPLDVDTDAYGLIYDIHIDDDGLVRQLVTAETVDESVIADNRANRNVPLETSVITVGYRKNGTISHLLPSKPPLSLDIIYLCDHDELCSFTSTGNFGYFRHILRSEDLPIGELVAAHLQQANKAQTEAGNSQWIKDAAKELIVSLRDDYAALMAVLSALNDAVPDEWKEGGDE